MERADRPGVRRFLNAIYVLVAIFLVSLVRLQPPGARAVNARPDRFSAGRALEILPVLMGSDMPHPIGSDPNAAVRNRVLGEFAKLGYSAQTQSAFDCSGYGVCATVQNVLARLDGTEPGQAVLLAAHYDSVPVGPGDSDDGAGVAAVLEIARALKSLPAPRHTVIFLIDDGEEAGLLGARAFVDFHPWASEVRAAVNVDARGSSGPSLMYETGSANDWTVRLYAHTVSHPATSSIAYTVYKQLPNDTDFSIFKAAGYQGLNFAIIGNPDIYHTPLDNLKNVDSASLQHQGDNALEVVEALANSDALNPPDSEAVFFDVFGLATIHWQARRSLLLAALATILIAGQIGFLLWTGRMNRDQFMGGGLLAWSMEIVSFTILAYILERVISLAGGMQANWPAHPIPLQVAFWMLPAAVVVIHARIFTRRAGFWGLWAGVWAWWSVLSILLAWRVPGVSYVVLVPLIVAALAGLPFTFRRNRKTEANDPPGSAVMEESHAKYTDLAALLPLGASAIIGFAPALLIYDALGCWAAVGIAVFVGLILTPLTPLCNGLREERGVSAVAIPGFPIVIVGLASFAAVVVPAYSARAPEHVNIEYWQDSDAASAQWILEPVSGRLPEPIRLAASFHRVDRGPLPWSRGPAFLADGPQLGIAPPTFTILEDSQTDSKRSYHALLRSERAAPEAMLLFPPGSQVDDVRVGGVVVGPRTARAQSMLNGWSIYACVAMPAEGVEISFSLPVGKPVEISAVDQTYGLPLEGQFLLKARPLTASPANTGDVTIVSRRVRLFP